MIWAELSISPVAKQLVLETHETARRSVAAGAPSGVTDQLVPSNRSMIPPRPGIAPTAKHADPLTHVTAVRNAPDAAGAATIDHAEPSQRSINAE